MKIRKSQRVVYRNNPLLEVVCQLSFDDVLALESDGPKEFQQQVASASYPKLEVEKRASVQILTGSSAVENGVDVNTQRSAAPPVYHFSSPNGEWKISICSKFFALSCAEYTDWAEFRGRFVEAFEHFRSLYPFVRITKAGLRYKDVIERDQLGLNNVLWKDLLQPFVLGPLASENLSEDLSLIEKAIRQASTQTLLSLEDCMVLLQSALLHSIDVPSKEAFLIDSDFFSDTSRVEVDGLQIYALIDKLHSNAGDLFRLCIKETLHHALSPI